MARAAGTLGVDPVRVARWFARREAGQPADAPGGGVPLHALLPAERDAIVCK